MRDVALSESGDASACVGKMAYYVGTTLVLITGAGFGSTQYLCMWPDRSRWWGPLRDFTVLPEEEQDAARALFELQVESV